MGAILHKSTNVWNAVKISVDYAFSLSVLFSYYVKDLPFFTVFFYAIIKNLFIKFVRQFFIDLLKAFVEKYFYYHTLDWRKLES